MIQLCYRSNLPSPMPGYSHLQPDGTPYVEDIPNEVYDDLVSRSPFVGLNSPSPVPAVPNTMVQREQPSDEQRGVQLVSMSATPFHMPDWDLIRPVFTNLYIGQEMKLKDVRQIMEKTYQFVATEHQYKKQIKNWGLSKIWTKEEKTKLKRLAVKYLAEGKPLPYKDAHGRVIPWDRVRRLNGRQIIPTSAIPHAPAEEDTHGSPTTEDDDHEVEEEIEVVQSQRLIETPPTFRPPIVPPQPHTFIPATAHSLEMLFRHTKNFYNWYNSPNFAFPRQSFRFNELANAYDMAFADIKLMPAESPITVMTAVGRHVVPYLRQPSACLLNELLMILYMSSLNLGFDHSRCLLQLFTKTCRDVYGPHSPLTMLLEEFYRLTSTSQGMTDRRAEFERPLIELMRCAMSEIRAVANTPLANLEAMCHGWSQFVQTLVLKMKKEQAARPQYPFHDPEEAERICYGLISWSSPIFGHRRTHNVCQVLKSKVVQSIQSTPFAAPAYRSAADGHWEEVRPIAQYPSNLPRMDRLRTFASDFNDLVKVLMSTTKDSRPTFSSIVLLHMLDIPMV